MNDVCKSNKYRAQWTVSADAVRSLFPGFLDGIHYYISHWCPTADQSPPTPPPLPSRLHGHELLLSSLSGLARVYAAIVVLACRFAFY